MYSPVKLLRSHQTPLSHYLLMNYGAVSGGATPGRARSNEPAGRSTALASALPIALLCFGNSVNRKYTFYPIWPLTALFWLWNNLSVVGGLCVLRATTKKVVNFFEEKSASRWPGSRMFWPRNDLAPLLCCAATVGHHGYHFWFMQRYPKSSERSRLHQSVCCGHIRSSAIQWWRPWVSKLGWMVRSGPDLYRCWSEDQWRILPWCASDSIATACHAWDLWRVLYLPARQCSCSPSVRDNQPSGTRSLSSFHQTFRQPIAQVWTRLTTKMWRKMLQQV